MEIATASRSPAPLRWGRLLLCVVVFGPAALFVLLPIGLGLERYVITGESMSGSIDRGSVVFERVVPVSDLRVGDVVSYPQPDPYAADDTWITHRIVAIEPDAIRTQGDALADVDPWILRAEDPTMSRVEFTVPWLGWVYLAIAGSPDGLLGVAAAVALVLLASLRLRRPAATRRAAAGAEPPLAGAIGSPGD